MIYNSLVLSRLNYCNYVWGNTYKSHLLKLYIYQKKAVRIITKSNKRSPSAPLFKNLQILSIYDLVTLNTLIFMYSIEAKILPDKFCNMFILNSNVHSYFTRQSYYLVYNLCIISAYVNGTNYPTLLRLAQHYLDSGNCVKKCYWTLCSRGTNCMFRDTFTRTKVWKWFWIAWGLLNKFGLGIPLQNGGHFR